VPASIARLARQIGEPFFGHRFKLRRLRIRGSEADHGGGSGFALAMSPTWRESSCQFPPRFIHTFI